MTDPGSGVLLLHAGIADRRMWEPQVETLTAAGFRPIAPDLPGFGDNPLAPGTLDHVGFAAGLLDAPAAVVGCSFGATVALELAASRPRLVQRLVLIGIGPADGWSEEAQAGFAEEEAALERGDPAAAAAQQARMWLAEGADPAVRALAEAMTLRSYEQQLPVEGDVRAVWPEPRATERLDELGLPTLVVVGSDDLDDVRAACERVAAAIPGAQLETIEGAGHLPSLERPAELNGLLLDFLR